MVDLSLLGPMPRELQVSSSGIAGRVELDCVARERRFRCESDIPAQHDVRVTVRYRASDGHWEATHLDLRMHGDEEEVVVRGSFDDDASLPGLRSWTYRRADPRIVLNVVAPPLAPGEPPLVEFTNGSEEPVTVQAQGAVHGHIVRAEDDTWSHTPRGLGCPTGSGPTVIPPATSAHVREIEPLAARTPLPRGTYSFVVEYEDIGARTEEHASRRVTTRFDVTETALPKSDVSPATIMAAQPLRGGSPMTLWTHAAPPSRPGRERADGREGSQLARDAPTLSNGGTIAGALSPGRSRHAYRLPFAQGEEAVVRIFARCKQAPCRTQVGMYWGREHELHGRTRWLHRAPPAWSVFENTFRARGAERVLLIGCREECDAEWEFYGRVQVRGQDTARE